jgi:hypothetical protein
MFFCTGFILFSHTLFHVQPFPIFQGVIALGGGFSADLLAFVGLANMNTGINLKRVLRNYPGFFQGLVKLWF